MAKYTLQANEAQVLKTEGVAHGDVMFTQLIHDLVLTTQNLVLIKKRFGIRSHKATLVFPLSTIKVHEGKAQAFVGNNSTLEVNFQHGQEAFVLRTKKLAGQWVEQINLVVVGHAHQAELPEGPGELFVSQLKDVFGMSSSGRSENVAASLAANTTAGDCPSCGAPVSGPRGQVVPCSYCHTAIQF